MNVHYNQITDYSIRASDGEIGSVSDLLFDDRTWALRYVVVDTGKWLPGQKVLVAPQSFRDVSPTDDNVLATGLSKQQVKDSPDLSEDAPVSRQYEESLHSFYGWAPYWASPMAMTGWPYPDASILTPDRHRPGQYPESWDQLARRRKEHFDHNLRSLGEIKGYKISSSDGEEFGEVEDIIINTSDWSVVDLVLNSHRWLPGGKRVSCSPLFISNISEDSRTVKVELTKDHLLSGPDFNMDSYGRRHREEVVAGYERMYPGKPHQNSDRTIQSNP